MQKFLKMVDQNSVVPQFSGVDMKPFKVHIFWEGHKNFAKSSPNFWPINLCSLFPATVLNSSLCLSGSQSWNLIHWDGFWSISCLSVSNIPNIAKTWQCLECLSNLLKIQNWAGNTEKQVIGQKLGEDFTKFCGLLRIYELYMESWSLEFLPNGKLLKFKCMIFVYFMK